MTLLLLRCGLVGRKNNKIDELQSVNADWVCMHQQKFH